MYDSHHGLFFILRDQKLSIKNKISVLPMMPFKKCALNFESDVLKGKPERLAILKSSPLPFGGGPFLFFRIRKDLL